MSSSRLIWKVSTFQLVNFSLLWCYSFAFNFTPRFCAWNRGASSLSSQNKMQTILLKRKIPEKRNSTATWIIERLSIMNYRISRPVLSSHFLPLYPLPSCDCITKSCWACVPNPSKGRKYGAQRSLLLVWLWGQFNQWEWARCSFRGRTMYRRWRRRYRTFPDCSFGWPVSIVIENVALEIGVTVFMFLVGLTLWLIPWKIV